MANIEEKKFFQMDAAHKIVYEFELTGWALLLV